MNQPGEIMARVDGQLPVEAAWDAIRLSLRRSCGERTFDGWLKPLKLAGHDAELGEVRLAAPSAFMANWVQTHFAEQLAAAWRAMLPDVTSVLIEAPDRAMFSADPVEPAAAPIAAAALRLADQRLDLARTALHLRQFRGR